MGFKDKINKFLPEVYILGKVKDKGKASQIIKGYKAIKAQNLFDEEFYLKKYPKTSTMDPLLHYLFFGFKEGKKPNKDFDGPFYVNKYDVDINPLIHYALIGRDKGYDYNITKKDLANFNDKSRKSLLFILHESINNIGGTGFTSLDIIKSLNSNYQKFILTSNGEEVELWEFDGKLSKLAQWNIENSNIHALIDLDKSSKIDSKNFTKELFNQKLAGVYDEILTKLSIDVIHVNHLIHHSFDIFDLASKYGIPYLISIHDFYYCCPSIHLIDKNLNYCNLDCCNNCAIDIDRQEKLPEIIQTWQKYCHGALKNAYLNICPSQSCLDIYKEFYPDLDNFKVIEHGRNFKRVFIDSEFNPSKIKILFPGFISEHKGSLLIKSIKELDKDNKLEFHFLGTTIPNLNKFGKNHGRYERDDFVQIVSEIKPNLIGIMSVCPETYSHTLSESMATGIPIIATDLGAQKERVTRDDIGWIVNHRNPKEIYDEIINISEEDYKQKALNISNVELKSFDEMIKEYSEIYEGIL